MSLKKNLKKTAGTVASVGMAGATGGLTGAAIGAVGGVMNGGGLQGAMSGAMSGALGGNPLGNALGGAIGGAIGGVMGGGGFGGALAGALSGGGLGGGAFGSFLNNLISNLQNAANSQYSEYDIYSNTSFKWTQSTTQQIVEAGVPYVELTEYENQTDILHQAGVYLTKGRVTSSTSSTFSDLYSGTYKIQPTGVKIKVPYLSKDPMHIETKYKQIDPVETAKGNWGLMYAHIKSELRNIGANITDQWDSFAQFLLAGDHDGTEAGNRRRRGTSAAKQSPKAYEESHASEFSTSFYLINEDKNYCESHYRFIIQMMMANSPSYPDPMRVKVPHVYKIQIPSLLYLPIGFLSSFDAKPQGGARMIGGIYCPDAWHISMSFNSLFPISTQLLSLLNDQTAQKAAEDAFINGLNDMANNVEQAAAAAASSPSSYMAPA